MTVPRLLLFSLALIAATLSAASRDQDYYYYLTPIASEVCVQEGTFGCKIHERLWQVPGASCREDCVHRNKLDSCVIQNRCYWDAASGCFRKQVCTEVSNLGTCRRWEDRIICGR